jgi:hypothetical protein
MPAKTKLKTASCPLGKWEATVTKEDVEKIREFLERDNQYRTTGELTELSHKFLGPHRSANGCSSCNRKLLTDLKKIVDNADTQA